MLRDLFERVKEMEITDIIVGDLTGIRDGKDYGRKTNQKLHNFWSHAKTIKRIRELGEEYKIQITEVSERNTSKTCCMCGKQHNGRVKRGLHYCKEAGTVVNADVNGAVNILKVAVYGSLSDLPTDHNNRTIGSSGSRALASPLKLRWEYHQWH
jgi:putative transposase